MFRQQPPHRIRRELASMSHDIALQINAAADATDALDDRLTVLEATHAFPIGSIYTNITGTNPATELGYGTWTAFGAGKVLAGYKAATPPFNVVEAAIGDDTHTHLYDDVVNHTHPITATQDSHIHTVPASTRDATFGGTVVAFVGTDTDPDSTLDLESETPAITASSSNPTTGRATGTTDPTASLPAAIVVHFWKRTA